MWVPYSESLFKAEHIYFLFMVHFGEKHDVDEFYHDKIEYELVPTE